MKLVEKIQGNQHDADWKERLSDARVDHLKLDQWDAQKNRFRKKTVSGTELAVSLDRGTFLKNGDVLDWDSEEKVAIVADIALKDVLVVSKQRIIVNLQGHRAADFTTHDDRKLYKMCANLHSSYVYNLHTQNTNFYYLAHRD